MGPDPYLPPISHLSPTYLPPISHLSPSCLVLAVEQLILPFIQYHLFGGYWMLDK